MALRRMLSSLSLGHERVEGSADAAEEGFGRRLREQETGLAVLDGCGKPAGLMADRQRAEALRVHLAQAAWLGPVVTNKTFN